MGNNAAWSSEAHLMANVIDLLQAANWQRGGDNNAPRPKPIARPSNAAAAAEREASHLSRAEQFLARQRLGGEQ